MNHPDLVNSAPPRTQDASLTTTERGGTKRKAKKTRKLKAPRLSIFDVSKLVVAKGIKSSLELLALASRQMKEGKEDLAQFIANRGSKVLDKAIQVGWEMEEAEEKLKRKQMTRMDILQKALEGPCIANCNGELQRILLHAMIEQVEVFRVLCVSYLRNDAASTEIF